MVVSTRAYTYKNCSKSAVLGGRLKVGSGRAHLASGVDLVAGAAASCGSEFTTTSVQNRSRWTWTFHPFGTSFQFLWYISQEHCRPWNNKDAIFKNVLSRFKIANTVLELLQLLLPQVLNAFRQGFPLGVDHLSFGLVILLHFGYHIRSGCHLGLQVGQIVPLGLLKYSAKLLIFPHFWPAAKISRQKRCAAVP